MSTLKGAVLSEDKAYRYLLTRFWDVTLAPVVWVMLNPSTADAEVDDPTIVRCTNYAQDWGYGGVIVLNLYAYRATDPRELLTAADPVGPNNDAYLAYIFDGVRPHGGPVVCGWGNHAKTPRVAAVQALAAAHRTQLHALRTTKSGQPGHPLYLPGRLTPVPWP